MNQKTSNHYALKGPSIISFSGGRTSAYMLRMILDSNLGKLPEQTWVVFANTGLEHDGTYRFIQECSINWDVPITWLERTSGGGVAVVTPETASRRGEPFDNIIEEFAMLPNAFMRFCTQHLKVAVMDQWARGTLGLESWTEVLGLRYDEPRRVARLSSKRQENRDLYAPLYHAKCDLSEVSSFWAQNNFDLDIPPNSGNCVGCFLKGASKLTEAMRESPEYFDWWVRQENRPLRRKDGNSVTGRFSNDKPSYADLLSATKSQRLLFQDDDSLPCSCTD